MDDMTSHRTLAEEPREQRGIDAAKWRECASLEDAGELMAQWFEGYSRYIPGYAAAQPDAESEPLLVTLAKVNRLGLFTEQSQPGEVIYNGSGQRAFVTGFCSADVASTISEVLLPTELVVVAIPPGESSTAQICVTMDAGSGFTWLGAAGGTEEVFESYREDSNDELARVLSECWELHIFDPVWGRTDRLWECLMVALEAARATRNAQ